MKGSNCSKEGKKYESTVHQVTSRCIINGTNLLFNTQTEQDLAGCRNDYDIVCNYYGYYNIPIEIKKSHAPDWTQCTLIFENNLWKVNPNSKLPTICQDVFNNFLYYNTTQIFNGKLPPFINQKIEHNEWKEMKKNTSDFKDMYFDCCSHTIKQLYARKGCYYIQISNKGLYHLGNDVCNFNVPEFICPQRFRLRTKIHSATKSSYSVSLSCQPISIDELQPSPYSLDNIQQLPQNLVYVNTF